MSYFKANLTREPTVFAAALFCCALHGVNAYAGPPMGFKDASMIMGEHSARNSDWMVNYATSQSNAFGASYHLWRGDGKMPGMRVEHTGVSFTRLVKRWNNDSSQANIWFGIDAGNTKDALNFSGTRFGYMPSLQFDWETTRAYTLASVSTLRITGGRSYDTYKAQAGFSFYEAEFDEWQPWLVVEVKHMPGMYEKPEVTPFLRFISNSLYLEIGANLDGKPRFGLMKVIHF
jgi:hypothetical protein